MSTVSCVLVLFDAVDEKQSFASKCVDFSTKVIFRSVIKAML